MRRPPRIVPLATLRANWSRVYPGSKRPTATIAQACEYGKVMGEDALRRQWIGPYEKRWREVCRNLDIRPHLRAVA